MHALTFLLCAPFSSSQPLVLIVFARAGDRSHENDLPCSDQPILSGFEMAKVCLLARTIQHIHKYDM